MNVEQLDGFFAARIPQVFHALLYSSTALYGTRKGTQPR